MTALTITGVRKSFGRTEVLRGVDLHVPQGSLTAVLGPSGCGKTTLLRVIAGFTDPDEGSVLFSGDAVFRSGRSVPPQQRRAGYVPQEGALFPHLNVADNIGFGLSRAHRRRERVAELLDLVGLSPELAKRYPHELSGGQQQRVALARALAPEPKIVLLDEPFSALDAALRDGTRRAVTSALRATGATAVLVTHDQAEALSLADQVGVMRDGLLAQLDTPSEVYTRPSDTDIADFVGEAILLPATIRGNQADCVLGSVPVTGEVVDGTARVLIRPEQLSINDADSGVPARVREVRYFGHDASVRLDLHGDGTAILVRVPGQDLPAPDTDVRLTVRGRAVAYRTPTETVQPAPPDCVD